MPTQSAASYVHVVEGIVASGLTQTDLATATGTSPRAVQTWAAGTSKPTGDRVRHLLDVALIVALLRDVYTPEGVSIWLRSRNRNLNLRRPLDLLGEDQAEAVIDEANRMVAP